VYEILQSLSHNIHTHNLNWYLGQQDNPIHQKAPRTANTCIVKNEAKYPTLPPWQQPALDYGLAYLCHRGTSINESKFTKHCCEKFLWITKTFQSVNWKACQHQGKKLGINQRTHLLKYIYKWLPIGKTLVRIPVVQHNH
jgi:hypothetical protein